MGPVEIGLVVVIVLEMAVVAVVVIIVAAKIEVVVGACNGRYAGRNSGDKGNCGGNHGYGDVSVVVAAK